MGGTVVLLRTGQDLDCLETAYYCCPSTSVRIGPTVTAHRDGVRKILLASCRCTVALEFLLAVPYHLVGGPVQSRLCLYLCCAFACALVGGISNSSSHLHPTLNSASVSVSVSVFHSRPRLGSAFNYISWPAFPLVDVKFLVMLY